MSTTTYSVTLWGSDPRDENDDCWSGRDFESWDDALACYGDIEANFENFELADTRFVMLEGGNLEEPYIKEVKGYASPSDDDWSNEMAMQAGMGMGISAYNDWRGY